MKQIISILLTILMLTSFTLTAFAEGDPNADGGGGNMGGGSSTDTWTPGMDGVRVSVVDVSTGAVMGTPIDYTNNPPQLVYHFGKKSKIQYRNGAWLSFDTSTYTYKTLAGMPPIIKSQSIGASIEAIKQYFCSEAVAGMIAKDFGISFETLTGGKYKLLIEPVGYFKFQGQMAGMTAHEAAMYDQLLGGQLNSRMGSFSHQNLPLSLFLERPDLGFPAYGGATSGKQSNGTIMESLGMGTITYTELEAATPPPVISHDVEYRINTEVITAVILNASSEINPKSPATVTFNAAGRNYTMSNVVIPRGGSQVVWCKWTTPAAEQTVTVTVSTNKGTLNKTKVVAKIVDLSKNPPPDPRADDRNNSFSAVSPPTKAQRTSAQWSVWYALWYAYWVWVSDWVWHHSYYDIYGNDIGYWCDHGQWEDHGWYNFYTNQYSASLAASSVVKPDDKNPTKSGNTMKSGYGVNNTVSSSFTTNAPATHVTGAQNAVSWFPEFRYSTYWRLLDRTSGGYSAKLEFKQNEYSGYNRRVHFTPVWYPNGNYNVYTWLIDSWTPDGMLSVNLNSNVTIQKSVFDDWHINPQK